VAALVITAGCDDGGTFERFTDRARHVLVLAQEEGRQLNHGFIGTEHLLLGLAREGEGVAAKALGALGITVDRVRDEVLAIVGGGPPGPPMAPPFTPRAKKVLELSLREAVQLGHRSIGTEHLLLGLVREGEGVAAQVLTRLAGDLGRVRQEVIRSMSGRAGAGVVDQITGLARPAQPVSRVLGMPPPIGRCSFCGRDTFEAAHFVSIGDTAICSDCVAAAHDALAGAEPSRHEVFLRPRVFGESPQADAVDEIARTLDHAFCASSSLAERAAAIEEFDELEPFWVLAATRFPGAVTDTVLDRVRFIDAFHAAVEFRTIIGVLRPSSHGLVVHREDRWQVSAETVRSLLRSLGVAVPHPPDAPTG